MLVRGYLTMPGKASTPPCLLMAKQGRASRGQLSVTEQTKASTAIQHLSKGRDNLKQNGTQENTPFSTSLFHAFHVVFTILFGLLASRDYETKRF